MFQQTFLIILIAARYQSTKLVFKVERILRNYAHCAGLCADLKSDHQLVLWVPCDSPPPDLNHARVLRRFVMTISFYDVNISCMRLRLSIELIWRCAKKTTSSFRGRGALYLLSTASIIKNALHFSLIQSMIYIFSY